MAKRILPIIALVLIGAIAVATVVLALVPKNHMPNLDTPNRISISSMDEQIFDAVEHRETFDKVMDAYKASFTESSLNALFQGRLGESAQVKYQEDSLTYLSSLSKYLRFDYNVDKTATVEDTTFNYRSAVIELVDNQGMYEVKIYLLEYGTTSTHYYISTIADTGNLVSVIADIE